MLVGIVAVVFYLFFISLYLPIGASSLTGIEWVIVLAWVVLGLVFYFNSIRAIKVNKVERENALFGKKVD